MNKTYLMLGFIPNEDILQLTKNAIDSISPNPLVVVDNGSIVGGGYLRSIANIYIRNPENIGFTLAINQGLKLINSSYVVYINNDIKLSPNWWEVIKDIIVQPNVGSVHLRMIPYDEPFNYGNQVWTTGKERWCHGSFYILKKEVIDKIGLFDETFRRFGYEDWDFWKRVRDAGFLTAYTNRACFQHKDSSTNNLLNQKEREESSQKNREYFKQKHGEYPEDYFANKYPEQLVIPWKPFP